MHEYIVTLHGRAAQRVYVRAASKSEARRRAVAGEWFDAEEIDFDYGTGLCAARVPVEERVRAAAFGDDR